MRSSQVGLAILLCAVAADAVRISVSKNKTKKASSVKPEVIAGPADDICARMHNNTALDGVEPMEMLRATAYECQKKCVDLYPSCAAVVYYYTHNETKHHHCYLFGKNSIHEKVSLVEQKPAHKKDLVRMLEIVAECHEFDAHPPLEEDGLASSTDKVDRKKRQNGPVMGTSPWSGWTSCAANNLRHAVRSQTCDYGRKIQRRGCPARNAPQRMPAPYAPQQAQGQDYSSRMHVQDPRTDPRYQQQLQQQMQQRQQQQQQQQQQQAAAAAAAAAAQRQQHPDPRADPRLQQQQHPDPRMQQHAGMQPGQPGQQHPDPRFQNVDPRQQQQQQQAGGLGAMGAGQAGAVDPRMQQNGQQHPDPRMQGQHDPRQQQAGHPGQIHPQASQGQPGQPDPRFQQQPDPRMQQPQQQGQQHPDPRFQQHPDPRQQQQRGGPQPPVDPRMQQPDPRMDAHAQQYQQRVANYRTRHPAVSSAAPCPPGASRSPMPDGSGVTVCINGAANGPSAQLPAMPQPPQPAPQEESVSSNHIRRARQSYVLWDTAPITPVVYSPAPLYYSQTPVYHSHRSSYATTAYARYDPYRDSTPTALPFGPATPTRYRPAPPPPPNCGQSGCIENAMKPGVWFDWSEWSQCSCTCGDGKKQRRRECSSNNCQGPEFETEVCNMGPCLTWSEWCEWSPCKASCGLGERVRTRFCHLGTGRCEGKDFEADTCDAGPCPEWAEWEDWSACSVSCGNGMQVRQRACLGGIHGDHLCPGPRSEERQCQQPSCSVWEQWHEWSACSASCGDGMKRRMRTCLYGTDCPGPAEESLFCYGPPCAEWTQWCEWSGCSAKCGPGQRARTRACLTSDQLESNLCQGPSSESALCDNGACCSWSDWCPWSQCDKDCGSGSSFRTRVCSRDGFGAHDDTCDCPGPDRENRECNQHPCTPQCAWTQWCEWGECSVTTACETGTQNSYASSYNEYLRSYYSYYRGYDAYGGAYGSYDRPRAPCRGGQRRRHRVRQARSPRRHRFSTEEEEEEEQHYPKGRHSRSRQCVGEPGCHCLGENDESQQCRGRIPCNKVPC